jgi:hypothetical protein
MKHGINDTDGVRNIYTEEGEDERDILRAIVIASFETANAVEIGRLHFQRDQEMTGEDADRFITLPPKYGNVVVDMDYVQGRQCKTTIIKKSEGRFILDGGFFMRDRGVPEPMLNRAVEILMVGADQNDSVPKVKAHMYKGENLTLRLRERGFERETGESDWDFRKRIFSDFYAKNPAVAVEFLFGASTNEWNETDKFLYLALGDTDPRKFAEGFPTDPVKMRKK